MFSAIKETGELYKLLNAANNDPNSIVFYSERDIYYRYFEGYIRFLLSHSDIIIYYITSDENDRAFTLKSDRFQVFYLNRLAPKAIENLKTKVIVMTVTELQNFFLKRSRFGANHVYIYHSMSSTHLQYKKGAFDHYDTIFCIGPYQVNEIRAAEGIYGLRRKTLVECGYWCIENLYREAQRTSHNGSILIAPSWQPGNLFESGIEEAIPSLATLGVPVILRPHPEFAKRFPAKLASILKKIQGTQNIQLETALGNQQSLLNAELLVTDWGGICFEYALGLERPVLFINTQPKIENPDYRDIPHEPIEFTVRNGIFGEAIEMNDLANIGKYITRCLQNRTTYRNRLEEIRRKYLFNWLQSDQAGGKYLSSLIPVNLGGSPLFVAARPFGVVRAFTGWKCRAAR